MPITVKPIMRFFPQALCIVALFSSAVPSPLWAQGVEEMVVQQLYDQGYVNVTVSRTFLGRLRVLAQQNGVQREVVVNPRTGEVLRDAQTDLAQGTAIAQPPQVLLPADPNLANAQGNSRPPPPNRPEPPNAPPNAPPDAPAGEQPFNGGPGPAGEAPSGPPNGGQAGRPSGGGG